MWDLCQAETYSALQRFFKVMARSLSSPESLCRQGTVGEGQRENEEMGGAAGDTERGQEQEKGGKEREDSARFRVRYLG